MGVLLLDEIEKAHKDVLNVFLQIFGEGRLTDNMGKLIDFRNTIIIMTSNLSTAGLEKRSIGFNEDEGLSKKEAEAFLRKAAGKYFSPEFLNRIDEVVIFNKISKENIEKIFDIEFSHTVKRSKQAGYPIEISNSAKKLLCEKGYSDKFGARQMKRAIKQEIENSIAAKIISEEIREGFVVYIDSDGEGLTFQEKSE
jgi:ATP-dependent Clp protease ATP-binding subunit ClpC